MMPLYRDAVIPGIRSALAEDIGMGDITSLSVVDGSVRARGIFVSKDTGIVAGLDIVRWVFEELSQELGVSFLLADGDGIKPGDRIAIVEGPARAVLMGERVSLNYLQRLSAVATLTRAYVDKVAHTKASIVDTRKTTPGFRVLEKYAVRVGGGRNHRMGLFDAVMIKDNHIVAAGGIGNAVDRARKSVPFTVRIEVECENRQQVEEALMAGADIIMLDNMSVDGTKEMVDLISGRAIVEVSGNMDEKPIVAIAETGVDIISIGKLTRGAGSLDISLDLELMGR